MSLEWLVQWRKTNFPSQSAIAKAAGITPARYSRIENGYCDIRPEEADALAEVLHVTREAVMTGSVKPEAKQSAPAATPPPATAIAAVAVQAPAIASSIRNDDLNDPKNFTLTPPIDLLTRSGLDAAGTLRQLKERIFFAEKVLHTSKVRPSVWVAWRDFSRNAQAFIRTQQTPPTLAPALPIPAPVVVVRPVIPPPHQSALPATARPRGNKNVYGHFVDVAREILSPAITATLTEQAISAKQNHPEVGFMKHFRRIAQESLTPDVFDRMDREAVTRNGDV